MGISNIVGSLESVSCHANPESILVIKGFGDGDLQSDSVHIKDVLSPLPLDIYHLKLFFTQLLLIIMLYYMKYFASSSFSSSSYSSPTSFP